jgi:hypothetical protein
MLDPLPFHPYETFGLIHIIRWVGIKKNPDKDARIFSPKTKHSSEKSSSQLTLN